MYKSFCEHEFTFSLGKYLEVKLLGCRVVVCLVL
jgi:hypothetical protein